MDISSILNNSRRNVIVFDGNYENGKKECEKLNIPKQTLLYDVVCNNAGIIIDNWIYLLGQSGKNSVGIANYNFNASYEDQLSGLFVVAYDVIGGLFVIDISRFEPGKNMIWYFAPDTLDWECMNMKYGDFLNWALQGNVEDYFASVRWEAWRDDCSKITTMDKGILFYPFLWAKECNLETASKKVVPMEELISINFEYRKKMGF